MLLPAHVGVYGGGRMGAGIAHVFANAGSAVTVVEADQRRAADAGGRIERSLANAAQRQKLNDPLSAVAGRIAVTTDPAELGPCGLVIEAVPESVALKQSVLSRVEGFAPSAALATNTSSLSVDEIASVLTRPDAFLGLHFFNPVPASALVEIVVGAKTASSLVSQARDWIGELGLTAITVQDSAGFASSRLGVALALEAMRMLQDGVASAEDIDTAMTLGYKHPMGPLRTTDLVGLDVRLAIAEHLARELGPRFDPPTILREKVAQGHLGRKSGLGFYQW